MSTMHKLAAVEETIEDLERALEMPQGELVHTVEVYNRHAEQSQDPAFHKQAEYLQPLSVPPFAALDCSVESSIYAAFTLGGLQTDVDGRVLRPEGDPIPGLWAAGRTTSGLAVGGYSSGLSLGDGTFFGRRSGRSAAAAET